jgi:alpha-tubulin suppressor-like RCC1 family protein
MTKISVGEKVSAVVDEDNHVYTWGIANTQGQLGRKSEM